MRRHAAALAGATIVLVAAPWFLLQPEPTQSQRLPIAGRPLRPAPAAAIDDILAHAPFGPHDANVPDEEASRDDPGDPDAPPQIVGIVGRLPDRAVVLVRRPAGGTRTLGVGESFGRWRLVSIGADAALFSDGAHRARVELPAADPPQ